jgi:NitT/TauT family transport system permease protein
VIDSGSPRGSSANRAGAHGSAAPAPAARDKPAAAPPPPSVWESLTSFRGTTSRRTDIYVGISGFVVLLVLWSVVTYFEWVQVNYLVSFKVVIFHLYDMFVGENVDHSFIQDIGISVYRVGMAFLLSAVMAIPLGILMSSYRIVNGLVEPIVDFIRYLPVPALVPLTVVWLGIGETSKITLLWIGTFFQLVLLVTDDARRVPREYIEIGMTVGAKPRSVLRHIILPAMLPNMVDNLRITLGWCWTYLIVAEIVAARSGIGYVIMASRRYGKVDTILAGVLVIGIIGLATDQAIRWAHRRWFAYLR